MKPTLEILADTLRSDPTYDNVEINGDEILVEIGGAPFAVKVEVI